MPKKENTLSARKWRAGVNVYEDAASLEMDIPTKVYYIADCSTNSVQILEDRTNSEVTDKKILDKLTGFLNEVVENYKHKNNGYAGTARAVGYITCAEDVLRFIHNEGNVGWDSND